MGTAVFVQLAAECPYTLQLAVSPPQNFAFAYGIWAPSSIWFHNPNDISIGLDVFAGLKIVTDRLTDRQTMLLSL